MPSRADTFSKPSDLEAEAKSRGRRRSSRAPCSSSSTTASTPSAAAAASGRRPGRARRARSRSATTVSSVRRRAPSGRGPTVRPPRAGPRRRRRARPSPTGLDTGELAASRTKNSVAASSRRAEDAPVDRDAARRPCADLGEGDRGGQEDERGDRDRLLAVDRLAGHVATRYRNCSGSTGSRYRGARNGRKATGANRVMRSRSSARGTRAEKVSPGCTTMPPRHRARRVAEGRERGDVARSRRRRSAVGGRRPRGGVGEPADDRDAALDLSTLGPEQAAEAGDDQAEVGPAQHDEDAAHHVAPPVLAQPEVGGVEEQRQGRGSRGRTPTRFRLCIVGNSA